ncbi:MAG: hypothetical protein ACRENU_14710 [Gemmatimonadaceae bacterium]
MRRMVVLLLLAALALRPASAQQSMTPHWTFAVTPYFWAAGIDGDVASFGLPVISVDASFSDIFDALDFGMMAAAEARYDVYSFFGDFMYTKISGAKGTPRGVVAQRVEVGSEMFAGLLGGGYSLWKGTSGHIDFAAGLRLWSVDNDIAITGGVLDGRSESDGATWMDGVGGFRGTYGSYKAFLTGWALVGAGGAELEWDLALAPGFRFSDTFSVALGYRVLGIDYEHDGFVLDVREHGPILGVGIRF